MGKVEDETRFKKWLAKHGDIIQRIARSFAENEDDIEDLSQEISLQLWHSVPAYREEQQLPAWIYRIAFNRALNWQRAQRRHRQGRVPFEDYTAAPNDDQRRVEQLYTAIRRLEKLDRALALLYLDGMGQRGIAEISGLSENAVGVRIHRLKKKLAQIMEE